MTADDIVHSYMLSTGDDAIIPTVDQLPGATAEAMDRSTVRFTYPEPIKDLLFQHGGRAVMKVYSKAQYDAEVLEGYDRQFAGTGPFEFVSREPGEILYRRFDDYYGQQAEFEELHLRFVDEAATKLAVLLSGEAAIADLPRELMAEAIENGVSTVQSALATIQNDAVLNGLYCESGDEACGDHLPWYDQRIRKTMYHAINREELRDVLIRGGGADILVRYAMAKGHEGYDPSLADRFDEEYGYNKELAMQLMEEAGYPDAFEDPTILLINKPESGLPEALLMMEFLHAYLIEVGFQAELREKDHAAVGAMGRGREADQIHPSKNAPPRPAQVAFRAFYFNPGAPYQGWEGDWTKVKITEFNSEADTTI